MKAYFLIRLQLDGLELINYEDFDAISLSAPSFPCDFIDTLLTDL